jgi:hypothetical protein
VHRVRITNYSQQDVTFLEFISTDAVRVSGGSSVHHQEHMTVHTASGIVSCNDNDHFSSSYSTTALDNDHYN